MTQVKFRSIGGKGLTQAAWKYAMRAENARQCTLKRIENKERAQAEARKNVRLPKLKWMDRPCP